MSELRLADVHFCYPHSEAEVLRGIDLEAKSPESFLIIGPNLSGKTTLANLLLRYHLRQIEGTYSGDMSVLLDPGKAKLFGFTFEDPSWMFCSLRVEDEVAFGLESLGLAPEEIRRRVDLMLQQVGLAGFQQRLITTLSGGELQKLAIAAAVVTDPQIMITDDFLSNLDIVSVKEMAELLDRFRISTGSIWLDLSRRWRPNWRASHTVALLEHGKIIELGSPRRQGPEFVARAMRTRDCVLELPEDIEILYFANQELQRRGMAPILSLNSEQELISELTSRFQIRDDLMGDMRPAGQRYRLAVQAVTFSYGKSHFVLNHCDLQFGAGEVNILAGRNGSGKSTLAKIVAGLLQPDSGRVLWSDKPLSRKIAREKVALVFQNPEYHFIADSVRGEFEITGRLLSLSKSARFEQTVEFASMMSLETKLDASPFALTSGEKRRLAVALALMRTPEVLIVDEPTLGQDHAQSRVLGSIFEGLAASGITIILISHDPRFIHEFGSNIHLLDAGRVAYSGEISTLFAPDSSSDFGGRSPTINAWTALSGSPSCHAIPRTPAELIARLRIK